MTLAPAFRAATTADVARISALLEASVREIILLTQTAEPFFASRGYRRLTRDGLPPVILATAEFRTLCPASAECMSKRI